MSFVHLHVHSHYSLLDGLPKIPDLVSKAKEQGYKALALTDHGAMYGVIEFYKECHKQGIKPIIGMEGYIAPRELFLKQARLDDKNFHITLLAKNEVGYKNLMQLSTIGHVDGFYYRPRLDRKALAKYSEGIICLSGCAKGELRSAISQDNLDAAREIIKDYRDIYRDDYYLELQNLYLTDDKFAERQKNELAQLKKLSQEMSIPPAATCDVHYLEETDAEIQDILVCVQTGKEVSEKKRLDMRSVDLSLYTEDKIEKQFSDIPEAIKNTLKIADKCDLKLDLSTWHYPAFDTPKGKTDSEYLKELVMQGAKKRYDKITPEIQKRIDYELDIIDFKNYNSYILIFADFMSWSRSKGILTTARGSASGSIVTYCLDITSIDPLLYKVPFERFLTKERPSPPDIDADISDDHRDEVIAYVREKYGDDKVAQICTFGTMMARGSFRDVARVMGHEATWADKYAKMIPFGSQGFPMTLEKALEESSELKLAYDADSDIRQVYDAAQRIEGCARHVSVHAAGVVVTPTKLTDFIPLQREPKGRNIITQYDMYDLDPNSSKESVGALKLDFLGLRNLSILGRCMELVKKIKKIEVDVYTIPVDDKKTYDMLSRGLTFGVFQMSGSGMTRYIKELKPTQVTDLMAMVALYRPGPIENIPEFINRKNNPRLIKYPDPRLKEVLEMSYGLLVYQDDVLYTVIILAGYKPSEADAFRKAVGKKKPGEMEAQKKKFYDGCRTNGLDNPKIDEIWKLIEPFAAYGFNKAHAASYGMLAYRTAYMKANFTAEYMTALMTCEAANMDKVAEAVKECTQLGIEVLPPDVNESRADFTYVSDTQIRFGFNAIKNLGTDIINAIIYERKTNGNYTDMEDFLTRVKSKNLNKKSIDALVKAGAFDSLGDRGQLAHNVEKLLQFIKYINNDQNSTQASLFGETEETKISLKLETAPELNILEKLAWEKDLLGLYVSDHPFNRYREMLPENITALSEIANLSINSQIVTAGVIVSVRKIFTKKGDLMAFVLIEDASHQIETIVFPKILEKSSTFWEENKPIIIKGKVSERNDERQIIIDEVKPIEEATSIEDAERLIHKTNNRKLKSFNTPIPSYSSITVKIPTRSDSQQIQALKQIFNENPGSIQVHLELGSNGGTKTIQTKYKISLNTEMRESIEDLVGKQGIHVL